MIQAGLNTHTQEVFFFRAGQCVAYDFDGDKAPAGVQDTATRLPGLAGTVFAEGVDAALDWKHDLWGTTAYLFAGDQCALYDRDTNQLVSGPASIGQIWPELARVGFGDGFDDALRRTEGNQLSSRELIYFFKGDSYVRYDLDAGKAGEVKSIAEGWPVLKQVGFADGIDAVVSRFESGALGAVLRYHAYFFKGDQYVRLEQRTGDLVTGPQPIAEAFKPLAGTAFATDQAPAARPKAARATYTLTFANPGDDGGVPEPYGKVWLQTKDGTQFRLWTQRNNSNGEAPTLATFTNAIDLPFPAADIATVNAYVDEDDTWNGDDYLARGSKPFTGNGSYVLNAVDGSVTVQLTIT
ncbi:hemopexin repeat-containing protein [Streptomyces sp. NPDC048659]|uniref:hemopexin repeat-containing protein n=1 Tax=Streptomyces sp. NPDC048659 TaxID=3155489 RepID=UPI0034212AA4